MGHITRTPCGGLVYTFDTSPRTGLWEGEGRLPDTMPPQKLGQDVSHLLSIVLVHGMTGLQSTGHKRVLEKILGLSFSWQGA